MEALSDCLRVELRKWGISVSLIEPGSVKTPIWEKSQGDADRLAEQVPAERMTLYDADMTAVRDTAVKLAAHAMPVERVVRAVRHALSRHPHTALSGGL